MSTCEGKRPINTDNVLAYTYYKQWICYISRSGTESLSAPESVEKGTYTETTLSSHLCKQYYIIQWFRDLFPSIAEARISYFKT